MPPKKRAKTKPKPTQKQKQAQRQSVTVNVGSSKSKSKPRKSSGRGGLPPPSHMHNLAPTFVTNQQIDYTPLISSLLYASNKIGAPNSISQRTIENPVTPLSSTTQSSTSQSSSAGEMAKEAALRRAGPTAGNLQPLPSQADERLSMSTEDKPTPVRAADPIITERLVKEKTVSGGGGIPDVASGGGGFPEAESFVKKGRPFAQATRAVPLNQTYLIARRPAEEPSTEPKPEAGKKAETKADKQKKKIRFEP